MKKYWPMAVALIVLVVVTITLTNRSHSAIDSWSAKFNPVVQTLGSDFALIQKQASAGDISKLGQDANTVISLSDKINSLADSPSNLLNQKVKVFAHETTVVGEDLRDLSRNLTKAGARNFEVDALLIKSSMISITKLEVSLETR